jgi:hypothetical protein
MKQIVFLFLLTVAFVNGYAQKLPNKQELSLKAPANVKIDGKTTEWGGFKAYNSATGLLYTLANDEQNLYLILRAEDRKIIDKIFGGGISLFFNSANNYDKTLRGEVNYLALPKVSRLAIAEAMKDTINKNLINSTMSAALKTIGVKNLNGVGEEIISVYNEYGIMAASYLSNMNNYTCEIALPLKHIKSFISNKGVIHYTLQANAASLNNMKVVMNGKEVENPAASTQLTDLLTKMQQSENGASLREMMNDTNVSGEYTLVK